MSGAREVDTRDPREVFDEITIIVKNVKRGKMGFRLNENSETGIHISEVVPGSLADKAGLRVGDIIICFNGIRCSVKSKIKMSMLLPIIAESVTEDFKFTVIRDVPDQYSEEEDVDTSEVSDISDAESDVREQNIDSGNDTKLYIHKYDIFHETINDGPS